VPKVAGNGAVLLNHADRKWWPTQDLWQASF